MTWPPPGIPASAGALLRDDSGRLLVLDPTYKSGWTLPGGVMEADGESPWEACRREVLEETGLRVAGGRLVCVDTRPARPGRPLGLRFLFDCGTVPAGATIRLQREEISQHRFVEPRRALDLLRPAVRRRVREVLAHDALDGSAPRAGVTVSSRCLYLENGRPVA